MTKKNEVAVKETQELQVAGGRGFENVDMSDISMPRAKLLQSNSPEVSDQDYNFRPGDVIHSLLMEKLPEKFIPLSIWNSNILFVPREDGQKKAVKDMLKLSDEDMEAIIVCRAIDGKEGSRFGNCAKCGLNKFKGNEKPVCNATINVLCAPITEDETLGMPVVLQFSSTSFKHGKKFRDTAFYASATDDLFSKVYKIDSVSMSGNGNRWFEMKVKPSGVVPTELRMEAEKMYRAFAGRNIIVEEEHDEPSGDIAY
jgi:hypothetical protein